MHKVSLVQVMYKFHKIISILIIRIFNVYATKTSLQNRFTLFLNYMILNSVNIGLKRTITLIKLSYYFKSIHIL